MVNITTPRLNLREFVDTDFSDVYAYEFDPEVVRYVSYGPYSAAECRRDFEWHIAHQQASQRNFYHLALELPAEQRVIGWCGFELARENQHEAELGYALNCNYWGRGYMTEAARAVVAYAFKEMGVHRIWADCRPENTGSIGILKKLGMTQEGHLRDNCWFKDRWWDSLIFGLLEHEWRATQ